MSLAITKTQNALTNALAQARLGGGCVVFVPTMGALHAGHISLVRLAKQRPGAVVVVSIFVNPTQFLPSEDLTKYPRTLEADIERLSDAGADIAFVPDVGTVYPDGFDTRISVPALASRWDGAARPGHFDGVATVVARLFGLVKPDVAIFGEKDYQQLCIIRQMVQDLAMDIEIQAAPIMREADGLAMSSRNVYLTQAQRKIAPALNKVLVSSRGALKSDPHWNDKATQKLLDAGFDKVDYIALVDGQSLEPILKPYRGARLLAAAWLGNTRLIDNIEM